MNEYCNLHNCRILLIDDDELVRHSLKLAFTEMDVFTHAVASAEDGLHALRSHRFDIIISDYNLPGMSGLDFFRRVRESHPDMIKVLISADGGDGLIAKAYEIGVHDFLQKPFVLDALLATLMVHVRKRDEAVRGFVTEEMAAA